MKYETMRAIGRGRIAIEAARSGDAVRTVAVAVKLSIPMIVWARRILREGAPELVAAVEQGRVALYMAAELSRHSLEEQRRFLDLAFTRSGDRTISARCFAPQPACSHTEHEA